MNRVADSSPDPHRLLRGITAEIGRVQRQIRIRDALCARLDAVTRDLALCRRRARRLSKRLELETEDVVRLEKAGWISLVAGLTGTRDARLAKERREAAAARLNYEQCAAQMERLRLVERSLRGRIRPLAGLEERRRSLRDRKRAAVEAGGSLQAIRLSQAETDAASDIRELAEAIAAGARALADVRNVHRLLRLGRGSYSAEGYRLSGALDVVDDLTGGRYNLGCSGRHESLSYHTLRKAADAAGRAHSSVEAFKRELADVGTAKRFDLSLPPIDIPPLWEVVLVPYEGILEPAILERVDAAMRGATQTASALQVALMQLRAAAAAARERRRRLRSEIDELVLRA